jgi:hypothetical protein
MLKVQLQLLHLVTQNLYHSAVWQHLPFQSLTFRHQLRIQLVGWQQLLE